MARSRVRTLAEAVRQELGKSSREVVDELSDVVETVDRIPGRVSPVQRGHRSRASGLAPGRPEAIRSVHPGGCRICPAYSALARACATLGYDAEATGYSNQAMSLSAALPPPEKHLIAATHHRLAGDVAKAIEAYENLAKVIAEQSRRPDSIPRRALYEQSGNRTRRTSIRSRGVDLDPKFAEGLLALGRVDIRRGGIPERDDAPVDGAGAGHSVQSRRSAG